jgi:hypothetical protein
MTVGGIEETPAVGKIRLLVGREGVDDWELNLIDKKKC